MTDKQTMIQAARDALMEGKRLLRVGPNTPIFVTPEPDPECRCYEFTEDGPRLAEALTITAEPCPKCGHPGGEQVVHVCGPDDGALVAEAIEALIAWHMQSGIDRGDRLRTAAKKLWEMRETRT